MTQPGLIVIDVQNDFCEGGALEVPLGSTIVEDINVLILKYDIVVLSQDWHPTDHRSFAENHHGKLPYDTYDAHYGTQVLWPAHCVQGSVGADFHPRLQTEGSQLIVRKGFRREIDSYSVFFENDRTTPTGLHGYLQERSVTSLIMVGLAYDFCVQYSALDAIRLGYEVRILKTMTKSIDLNGSEADATRALTSAGVAVE